MKKINAFGLFVFAIILFTTSCKKTETFDIDDIKDAKGFYSTFRIDKISNDSIFATENDYQVSMPYDIDEINEPKN